MSHELRTPMNSVVSAGQLLKLSKLSADQVEYVKRMNISSQHMLSLINDILDLARLDQQAVYINNKNFQLTDVLQQTEQLVADQARQKSLKLVIYNHFHPLKKQLHGDPVRLQQVLLNLLTNAIKFTEQGDVRLTITPQAIDRNASLLFAVSDSGAGIAQESKAELFQPFLQADNSTARLHGGSGLGLAISAKLVSRMGGELQVKSELGKGSCFYFTLRLPLTDKTTEKNRTFLPVDATNTPGKLRALLIDDNEMNRFFNSQLLESLDVATIKVSSGVQALRCLQQHTFDLVFMDVSMPGMDGYQTARSIRADLQDHKVAIIALTAHAISGERDRCLAAGMDDYLPKPFTREELRTMLCRYGLSPQSVRYQSS